MSALVAVFFYLRVVVTLYMKPVQGTASGGRPLQLSEMLALVIVLAVMIALGVFPAPLLDLIARILP